MPEEPAPITPEQLTDAEAIIGLDFTPAERDLMLEGLTEQRVAYAALRSVSLPNEVAPSFLFDPRLSSSFPVAEPAAATSEYEARELPEDPEEMAFWPVTALSALIRSGSISSVKLTEMYLRRLRRYDPVLRCVITLTEDLALEQAHRADAEIAAGHYRGPLHGIPWGAKDLLATRGIRTTWGAEPYRDQVPDYDATVVSRLEAEGAVLVAKLSVGALAWGDVWYGGMTRNPWNVDEGSSGSSAGPGAATAAGLVGFAIGTETWGSIVSPSIRCGVTGLRPTFGRISRHGAMALSWTMDKIGPMCRSVEDCALVFNAIHGADGLDRSAVDKPFNLNLNTNLEGRRIGYIANLFDEEHEHADLDRAVLEVLRDLGAELVPIEMPNYPLEALGIILSAEAAAAFDELTRSGRDDMLTRQSQDAWPNVFRQARLIPAVEYIQANRVRTRIIEEMARIMADVDAYVVPAYSGNNLLLTNLTGHPSIVLPHGFTGIGTPYGITFVGRLDDETGLLSLAKAYQDATDFHLRRPTMDWV